MHSPSEILSQINGFFTGRNRQKSVDCSETSSDEDNSSSASESNGLFSGKFRRRSEEVQLRNPEGRTSRHSAAISSAANLMRRAKHDLKLNFKRLSFGDNTPPALPVRHFSVEIDELPPPIPERKCSLDNVLDKEFESQFKFHPPSTCPLPGKFTNCKKTYPSQVAKKSRVQRPSFQPPPPPPPVDSSSTSSSPTSPSGKFSLPPPLMNTDDVFLDPPWHSNHGDTKSTKNCDVTDGLGSKGDDLTFSEAVLAEFDLGMNTSSFSSTLPDIDEDQTEFLSNAQLITAIRSSAILNTSSQTKKNSSTKNGDSSVYNAANGGQSRDMSSSPPLPSRPLPAPPISPSPNRPLPPPPLHHAQKKNLLAKTNSNQLPVDRVKDGDTPPLLSFSPVTLRKDDVTKNPAKPKVKAANSSPLTSRPPRPLPLKPKPMALSPSNQNRPKAASKPGKPNGHAVGLDTSPQRPKSSNVNLNGHAENDDGTSHNGTTSSPSLPSSPTSAFSSTSKSNGLLKPPKPSPLSSPSSSPSSLSQTSNVSASSQHNHNTKPPRPPPPSIAAQPPSTRKDKASSLNPSPPPPPPPPPPQAVTVPLATALSQSPLPPPPTPPPFSVSDLQLPSLPPTLKLSSSSLFVPIKPATSTQPKSRPLPPPPSSSSSSSNFEEALQQASKINGHRERRSGVANHVISNGWGGKEVFDPREEDGDHYDSMEDTRM